MVEEKRLDQCTPEELDSKLREAAKKYFKDNGGDGQAADAYAQLILFFANEVADEKSLDKIEKNLNEIIAKVDAEMKAKHNKGPGAPTPGQ